MSLPLIGPSVLQAGRISCPHCGAAYPPRLVQGVCPVCRTPAPGLQPKRREPLRDDDRLVLIVALATLANLIVLGILAIAVLH